MTSNVKNTADLRNLLLEAIEGVRKGKVDHRHAQAISALSSRILQSARLDLDVMKMASDTAAQKPAPVSLMSRPETPKRVAAKPHKVTAKGRAA